MILNPATSDEFTFRDWPFYWIARANGSYLKCMEAELQVVNLDIPRWRVLMTLAEEKRLSVSAIADYAIVKLSTMTKIIQRMQKDGLVISRTLSTDGRVTEVLLTEKGHEASVAAWEAANRVYTKAFAGIGVAKKKQINTILKQVVGNLLEE